MPSRRRNAAQERHPCTARRQPDALRAGLWASGRPASREARVPAGQFKNAAPLGAQSAGQSATLENPAHFSTLPIVTGTAKTTGLVCEANRAGRREAAHVPPFAQISTINSGLPSCSTDKIEAQMHSE